MTERYRVEPTNAGFWPFLVIAGDGTRELFIGHRKSCYRVAAELTTAFRDGEFVGKREYDTLRTQVAELRAENSRLRAGMVGDFDLDALLDWSKEAQRLRGELEAARGLLREVLAYDKAQRIGDGFNLSGLLARIDVALNGTPAPEVQAEQEQLDRDLELFGVSVAVKGKRVDPADVVWRMKPADCGQEVKSCDDFRGDDTALVSSAKALLALDEKGAITGGGIGGHARTIIGAFIARMAEQGERQEAFVIRYPCKIWDGEEAESQEYAKGYNMALEHVEKLNATQQPGQDVQGLVEALEHYANCGRSGNVARGALAAHRQAQQEGEKP